MFMSFTVPSPIVILKFQLVHCDRYSDFFFFFSLMTANIFKLMPLNVRVINNFQRRRIFFFMVSQKKCRFCVFARDAFEERNRNTMEK